VVVAEVDVLAPLVVEVLLSEVCSSFAVDVHLDWALHSDHLLEQVEDVERIFYTVADAAMYSASQEEVETTLCFFAVQLMRELFRKMTVPVNDLLSTVLWAQLLSE
jgi:hypothetical protein